MTWTYTAGDDADLNRLRLVIGDTNTSDQLLANEELELMLDDAGDDLEVAAVAACKLIIAKLARDIDRNNLGMSATRSQKVQHYKDLLAELRATAGAKAGPFMGGSSVDQIEDLESDEDFIAPAFRRGVGDNNG